MKNEKSGSSHKNFQLESCVYTLKTDVGINVKVSGGSAEDTTASYTRVKVRIYTYTSGSPNVAVQSQAGVEEKATVRG